MTEIKQPQPNEESTVAYDLTMTAVDKFLDKAILNLVNDHLAHNHSFYKLDVYGEVVEMNIPKKIVKSIKPYLFWLTNQKIIQLYAVDMGLINFSKEVDALKSTTKLNFEFTNLIQNKEPLKSFMLFMIVAFQDHFFSTYSNKIIVNYLDHILVN